MSNPDALLAILLAPHAPAIETPKPAPFIRRYFYRCADCLTVAATLEKISEVTARSSKLEALVLEMERGK